MRGEIKHFPPLIWHECNRYKAQYTDVLCVKVLIQFAHCCRFYSCIVQKKETWKIACSWGGGEMWKRALCHALLSLVRIIIIMCRCKISGKSEDGRGISVSHFVHFISHYLSHWKTINFPHRFPAPFYRLEGYKWWSWSVVWMKNRTSLPLSKYHSEVYQKYLSNIWSNLLKAETL